MQNLTRGVLNQKKFFFFSAQASLFTWTTLPHYHEKMLYRYLNSQEIINERKKIMQRFIDQNLTRAYKKQTKSISQKLIQKTSI